ncbi:MAG: putative transposase [Sulfurimonas sp.]|jgi:putative transposase
MSLINHEELKKQLASGEITSLDDITAEFKNILKEVIQTASQEELTSHLGYNKHQESNNSNARNGYNEKTINSKYGQFDVSIPRDRESSFAPQLVKKREIYLDGTEDLILSLYTKGSFPTVESAFKVMYLATQEQQEKWKANSIRNWYEIYPQLSIFFSEIVSKYTK